MTKKQVTNVMVVATVVFAFAIGLTIGKADMVDMIVKVADATDYRNAYHVAVNAANGWFNLLLIVVSVVVFAVAGIYRDTVK